MSQAEDPVRPPLKRNGRTVPDSSAAASRIPATFGALLLRKIESSSAVSEEERRVILDLPGVVKRVAAHRDIASEGEQPKAVSLLADGFACRYKHLQDGRRQIMSFHIAGDIPDLQSLCLHTMDHSLATITASIVVLIPRIRMLDVVENYPGIARVLWRETLIDAAIFREWMVGIGRRTAYARIAHLMCEMIVRMRAVGLTDDHACDLPITQTEIGDALGLSTVHVNRTLQELRGHGLIEFRHGTLRTRDWSGLQAAGEFNPAYLHLHKAAG